MSRSKTTYLRLTPKEKKILSQVRDVLLTETKYYIEPIDVYDVENTQEPYTTVQFPSLSSNTNRKTWGKSSPQQEGIIVSLQECTEEDVSSRIRVTKKFIDVEVWYLLRVMEPEEEEIIEVLASKELIDIIVSGDAVAIWGKYSNDTLVAERIYNYTTDKDRVL